ncbi:Fic family protein [Niabella hibiscisoli]|uniref:Fic family protein n=1 Tax=Niabella hibiscisoli TaxID=1825928 RepID=UPI00374D23D3
MTLAAMLHYKFVRIHPFDDGNGRLARLLLNYVLLKNGYTPVVIKSDDKKIICKLYT